MWLSGCTLSVGWLGTFLDDGVSTEGAVRFVSGFLSSRKAFCGLAFTGFLVFNILYDPKMRDSRVSRVKLFIYFFLGGSGS